MQTNMNTEVHSERHLILGFSFGDWIAKPMSGLLEKNGHQVHLEPKIMDVLVCLARYQGEVVTRNMLLDEVWGKSIVTDDAITRCISELRTILGDTDRERTYIRTIPRRGYSLLVTVTPIQGSSWQNSGGAENTTNNANSAKVIDIDKQADNSAGRNEKSGNRTLIYLGVVALLVVGLFTYSNHRPDSEVASTEITTAASTENETAIETDNSHVKVITSVAVLPFANLNVDPQHEYFSDGLVEDIRNALLTATDIRVAARTSSSVFKNKAMDVREIADLLNVDGLLEGTVRIIDDKLRITTQLTNGDNGYAIWAASYERDVADKILLQTEVAEEIVKQLAPSLQEYTNLFKTATANVQAHDYYVLGRHHWNLRTAESLELAESYFQQAIDLDPDYALAYSGLADTLFFQTIYGDRSIQGIEQQAHDAIEKALRIEPDLAEAHASMGLLLEETGNLDAAMESYRRAVKLKPQYSMAQMWFGTALFNAHDVINANKHYAQALKVDPLHPTIQFNYLDSLTKLGKYDEALASIEHFSKINPSEGLLTMKLAIQLELGQYDKVLSQAVGHTFSGDYKPYANEHVVDALIQLQRFEEADRILKDNYNEFGSFLYNILLVKLALASRDATLLRKTANYIDDGNNKYNHRYSDKKLEQPCADKLVVNLHAVTEYVARDFKQADAYFNKSNEIKISSKCFLSEPEHGLGVQLYQASARLKLNPEDTSARNLLIKSEKQIDELRQLGWKSPTLLAYDIAVNFLLGDQDSVIKTVKEMVNLGWQPFGLMRASPLFDNFLNSEFYKTDLAKFSRDYKNTWDQCNTIELAKLGL